MSNEAIWRLVSIGLWKESTPWTGVSPTTWIPLTAAPNITPTVTKYEDESGIGRIEAVSDKFVVKKMSETNMTGLARATSFGHVLLGTFGTVATPSLVETGVYKHDFTIKNDNEHPSYTLVTNNKVGQEESVYNLFNTLDVVCEVENPITWTATTMGKANASTSGETVTYSSEEPFKVSGMALKFADDISGLGAASEVKVKSFNFSIAKNVVDVTENGSLEPTSFHNQQFTVTGDMELIYRDNTYQGYDLNGTTKAADLTITGTTLIGATEYNKLNFQFAKITFDEWARSDDNNGLMTQTMWFTATFSVSDSSMLTAYIQNTQSSQY